MNDNPNQVPEDETGIADGGSNLVHRLRAIPLGASAGASSKTESTGTIRDRLIYDCGFAAGADSIRRAQNLNLRRYQQLAVAASLVAVMLGFLAWQRNSELRQLARQADSQIDNGQDKLRDDSTKDLAAAWVAVQNRPAADNQTASLPLTPHSRSFDAIESQSYSAQSPSDQIPSSTPLRSKDFYSVLDLEV